MSSRDVSPDAYRRQDWRRRGDHYSPGKKNQGDDEERKMRRADCDFTAYSAESLKSHFRRTDHKPWEDGKERHGGGRTEKPRRLDPAPSNALEKLRQPDPAPSNGLEKVRRLDPAPSNALEKVRRQDPALCNALEKPRQQDPAPSNALEKPRRQDPAPSNALEKVRRPDPAPSDTLDKLKKPDPGQSNASEKQRRANPAPGNASGKQKKPDPAASVPGMIPEHIRRTVFVLQDYIRRKDREPVIGLEYILEYKVQVRSDKVETKYFCEICEMDSGVVPMLDHLCGFKHRKLYVGKEYPYILKALFSTKEDRAVFMRRMAMEIEQEEGTKNYKTDPLIRMVPMMNVKSTEAKQSKRRTRWDSEGDRQRKMKQALDYLDLYKVDKEDEVTTVEKLLEKLTANLKFHTDKLKEEALFPVKVARARDVAMSLMRNAVRAWIKPLFPGLQSPMNRIPPLLNEGPPGNINLVTPCDNPYMTPSTAFPQRPQDSPFNQKRYYEMAENLWKDQSANPNSEPEIDPTDEDIEFFNKLMALLAVLPDESPADDPELLMLKSFLGNMETTPANPLMQLASLTQEMASMENQPLNRMASNKPAAPMAQLAPNLMMQRSSVAKKADPADHNSVMPMAARLPNNQRNADSFLPGNRNLQNREFEMGNNRSVDQIPYRRPYTDRQPVFANPSQSDGDFGYDGRRAGEFGNKKRRSRFDNPAKPMDYEPTQDLYADRSSGMYNREWEESSYSNKPGNQECENYVVEQGPYSRVSQPPSFQRSEEERFRDDDYHRDLRRDYPSPGYGGRRPFDNPAWAERESDTRFAKRAKLDNERMTSHSTGRGRWHPADSRSLGPNVSAGLNRIKGQDLFTASLSEYSDRRFSQ